MDSLVTLDYGLPSDFLEVLIPFLSGMSLSDMDILLSRVSKNTFETFTDYIDECKRNSFKVFYKSAYNVLIKHMRRD